MGLIPVESRHCTYVSAAGTTRTFFCSSYEYCCGNACCRPAVITFYQLWYFWLSVIMILLLCSGGSWWYRFKYRNQFLSPSGHFLSAARPNMGQSRHTIGVFYYPGNDRVYLHNPPKDPHFYPHMGGAIPPPPYTAATMGIPASYMGPLAPQPSVGLLAHQPPPFTGPPPSYDTVVQMPNDCAPFQPIPTAIPINNNSSQQQQQSNVPVVTHVQLPPATSTQPYPVSPLNCNLRNRSGEQS